MRNYFLLFLLITSIPNINFAQKNHNPLEINEALNTVKEFRTTTPFVLDNKRLILLNTFETYSDSFPPTSFKEYLNVDDSKAKELEKEVPILYAYREAFDKLIDELETVDVQQGNTRVWLLYNMGFVVKTPTACFGIDVDHRLAVQLEPYLDFLCITHNHGDHANKELMDAMNSKGKPVISNFYEKSQDYFSTEATSYQIGDITIRTDISDHLRDPKLANFVTLYRIDCGESSGNFSMLHCGDSGFNPERFENVQGPVNLLVLRWGAPRENDIIGDERGQVQPDYAVLSHLIELRHNPYPKGQASITQTLKHLPNVKCDNTLLPFWGEMLIWDGSKLK